MCMGCNWAIMCVCVCVTHGDGGNGTPTPMGGPIPPLYYVGQHYEVKNSKLIFVHQHQLVLLLNGTNADIESHGLPGFQLGYPVLFKA